MEELKTMLDYKKAGREKELIGRYIHIKNRYYEEIKKIVTITKTGVKVGNSDKIFTFSGRERGGDIWNTVYAELMTDEEAIKIKNKLGQEKRKRELIGNIKLVLDSLPLDVLIKMHNLLPKKEGE